MFPCTHSTSSLKSSASLQQQQQQCAPAFFIFGTCWHRSGGCARPRGASAKTAFPLQASSVRSIERTLQQWLRALFPFVGSVDIGAFKRTFYPTCIFAPKHSREKRQILLRHPCSSNRCETVDDFGSISPKRQLWANLVFF